MAATPKLQIKLNQQEFNARNFLESLGFNVNLLIKRFLITKYEEEKNRASRV